MKFLDSKEISGRRLRVRNSHRGRRDSSSSGEWRKNKGQSPAGRDDDSGRTKFSLSDEDTKAIRGNVLKGCVRLHLAVKYSTDSTRCRICNEMFNSLTSFNQHPCPLSLMDRISATIENFLGESGGLMEAKDSRGSDPKS